MPPGGNRRDDGAGQGSRQAYDLAAAFKPARTRPDGGYFCYPVIRDRSIGADAIWQRAEQDLLAGRFDRVDAALKRLARLREPSPLDFLLKAKYAMARHRPDQAITDLRGCRTTIPWVLKRGCWPARSS